MPNQDTVSATGEEFALIEGTHKKYWQIIRAGRTIATRYGRIGSLGQVTIHHFDSLLAAGDYYYKLTTTKENKGYLAISGTRTAFSLPAIITTQASSTNHHTGRGGTNGNAAYALFAYWIGTLLHNGHALVSGDPLFLAMSNGRLSKERAAYAAFAGYKPTDTAVDNYDDASLASLAGLTALTEGFSLASIG